MNAPETCLLADTGLTDISPVITVVGLCLLAVLIGATLLLARRTASAAGRGGAATLGVLALAGALALTGSGASPASAASAAATNSSCATDTSPTPSPTPTTPVCTTDVTLDLTTLALSLGSTQANAQGIAGLDAATRAELDALGATIRLTETDHMDAVLRWYETVNGSRTFRGTAPYRYANTAWTETFTVTDDILVPAEPITRDTRTSADYEELRRTGAVAAGVVDYTAAQYEWDSQNTTFEVVAVITITDRCGTRFTHTYPLAS